MNFSGRKESKHLTSRRLHVVIETDLKRISMESWYIFAPSLAPSQTTVTTKAWNTLPRSRMVVSFPRRQSIHSLEFSIITEFIDFIAPTTNDSGWDSTLHDLVYSGDEILECFTVSWEDVFRFVAMEFGLSAYKMLGSKLSPSKLLGVSMSINSLHSMDFHCLCLLFSCDPLLLVFLEYWCWPKWPQSVIGSIWTNDVRNPIYHRQKNPLIVAPLPANLAMMAYPKNNNVSLLRNAITHECL